MILCIKGTYDELVHVFDQPLRDIRRISLLGLSTDNLEVEPVVMLRLQGINCNHWLTSVSQTQEEIIVPFSPLVMYASPLPIFSGCIPILSKLQIDVFNTSRVQLTGPTQLAVWLLLENLYPSCRN